MPEIPTPIEKMYKAGFGTGHGLDLRPTQVKYPTEESELGEGDRWAGGGRGELGEVGFVVHNILRRATEIGGIVGALEPIPVTMCGIRLESKFKPYPIIGYPYNEGPTTCSRCGFLAAWGVVSVP